MKSKSGKGKVVVKAGSETGGRLKVVGSASAFSFKGKSVPIPEIARQLGVTHLVEGTVLQEDIDDDNVSPQVPSSAASSRSTAGWTTC